MHPSIRILLASLLLAATSARAEERFVLAHQGRLLGEGDVPVDRPVTLRVRIYARHQPNPGETETPLWTGDFPSTRVSNGIYSLLLGQADAQPLSSAVFEGGGERWLSVAVDSGPELSPRLRIGAVARALVARDAESLGGRSPSYYTDAANLTGEVGAAVTWRGAPIADAFVAGAAAWHAKLDAVSVSGPLRGDGREGSPLAIDLATAEADGILSKSDFATFAAKIGEGDPRLADARSPLPGSNHYVRNGTAAQTGDLNLTGSGKFGSLTVTGKITGDGSGLTKLDGSQITGRVPGTSLPANVPLLDATARQAFAGSLAIAGDLRLAAPAASEGAPGPCAATDAGTMRFSGRLEVCDGAFWRISGPFPTAPAHYRFDETSGTAVSEQFHPAANRGRATGVAWVPAGANGAAGDGCRAGGCVRFDGTAGSHVALPSEILHGLTEYTISFWARGTTKANAFIFSLNVVGNDNYLLLNGPSDTTLSHFVVRRTVARGVEAFRDRVRSTAIVNNVANDPVLRTVNGGLHLAQDEDCPGGCFEPGQAWAGTLDELKILPYAVSDADIANDLP